MIEWCSFYGGGDIPKCQRYRGVSIVEVGAVHGHGKKRGLSMAVFTLETDSPSETENPSSKSVKLYGKTDG